MKRFIVWIAAAYLVFMAGVVTDRAFAASRFVPGEFWNGYRIVGVRYNGKEVDVKYGVPPIIIEGRTVLPLRDLAELFNKKVSYDGSTFTVVIEDQ
jgi:hypothetical protein